MTGSAPLLWQKTPETGHFINSVACSADGTRVIAGTFLHTYPKSDAYATTFAKRRGLQADIDLDTTGMFHTYCWDYQGNLLWSVLSSTYEGVYWVAMSADGNVAASGGWYSQSPLNGYIAAYDAGTGAPLMPNYPTDSRVNQVALSANGTVLAAASNRLHLFINTGSGFPGTPWEWTPPPSSTGDDVNVIACGVSADGQYVCAGTSSGKVVLFKIANGAVTQTSPTWPTTDDGSIVHSLAMATNGAGFAAGMSAGQFGYFDCASFLTSGTPTWVNTLSGNAGAVYGVGIAGDAGTVSVVVNTGDTGEVAAYSNAGVQAAQLWLRDLPANPNETSIDGRGIWVATADGHPDGTPGHFTLFNASSGDQVWQFTTGNMSWPIQLSENGRVCVAGSDDGSVYFFAPLLLCPED